MAPHQDGNTTSNHYTSNTNPTTTNNNNYVSAAASTDVEAGVGNDTAYNTAYNIAYNTGANVHQQHDHAEHTVGFAPVHERTTVEGHHTEL